MYNSATPDVNVSRIYQTYYDDLSKHPVLTYDQERKLLIRYRTCPHCNKYFPLKVKRKGCPECGDPLPKRTRGRLCSCGNCNTKFDVYVSPEYCPRCGSDRDVAAREELVNANLRFVVKTAKSFSPNFEQLLELISAGNVGLMIAVDKFDVKIKTKFLTYAAWWVRKEMMDEINSNSTVHLPSHKRKEQQKLRKHGAYICRHCDLRIEGSLRNAPYSECPESSEHEFVPILKTETLNATLPMDDLVLTDDTNIERDSVGADTSQLLRKTLNCLNLRPRDKFILLRYYDMPTFERRSEPKSLPQLAAITGITPERVRQIKERTLRELRSELKRRNIEALEDVAW